MIVVVFLFYCCYPQPVVKGGHCKQWHTAKLNICLLGNLFQILFCHIFGDSLKTQQQSNALTKGKEESGFGGCSMCVISLCNHLIWPELTDCMAYPKLTILLMQRGGLSLFGFFPLNPKPKRNTWLKTILYWSHNVFVNFPVIFD